MLCHPIVKQQKVDMGVSSNKSGIYIWKDLSTNAIVDGIPVPHLASKYL